MPRRANSFARALKDAEKRLAKAQTERAHAQTKLGQLANEIPALERTIFALKSQTSGTVQARVAPETAGLPVPPKPTVPEIPTELAKFVGPQDLSGMGSVPAPHQPSPTKIETEADTLPEPDGEELSE